jgi:hypothetical protein
MHQVKTNQCKEIKESMKGDNMGTMPKRQPNETHNPANKGYAQETTNY